MTVENIKNLLTELCNFDKVNITQTFSVNEIRILQVRCLTVDSHHTFELTYPDSGHVDLISDITYAAKLIDNIISKNTPI
ncbi:hypothetical protein [Peribacillus sp. R9-11]|uniref:hypothetical protein n=1 Tax=Peribacillus sp. R9-11 TaxID=3073271 RepID=UPI0028684696|nr:hypothetical protein [Peribacillus sp. R9-11]WMX58665.1 hypothetical protein RE409_27820 [Peribacillus sp. R9-11]